MRERGRKGEGEGERERHSERVVEGEGAREVTTVSKFTVHVSLHQNCVLPLSLLLNTHTHNLGLVSLCSVPHTDLQELPGLVLLTILDTVAPQPDPNQANDV